MSTLGLWIVTGLNSALIALVGGFTYFGLSGITRVVTETGAELAENVEEVSKDVPAEIAKAIKEQGANAAGAATSMANNQVSSLTGDATGRGLEMVSKIPTVEARLPTADEARLPTADVATLIRGGRKQTKGNKPKKIRKPRTKKNIKKVGNQMYMNFSL